MEEIGFEDPIVMDHMENGVRLVGWEEDSPLYSKRFSPPSITEAQLSSDAVWRQVSSWTGSIAG